MLDLGPQPTPAGPDTLGVKLTQCGSPSPPGIPMSSESWEPGSRMMTGSSCLWADGAKQDGHMITEALELMEAGSRRV